MTSLTGTQQAYRGALIERVIPRSMVADVATIAAGAAAIALSAQVRIPLPFTPVPITGQTFAILLVGSAFGLRRGTLAVLLYLAVGVAGAPVFTNGGSGLAVLIDPTGGYLIGFLAASALLGRAADRSGVRRILPAVAWMLLGSAVIYAFGLAGLILASGMSPARAVEVGVVPFLLGDLLKAGMAGALLPVAWSLLPGGQPRR